MKVWDTPVIYADYMARWRPHRKAAGWYAIDLLVGLVLLIREVIS